jgi:peptidoglycan/xylan/chitin deacetylase (PgdA/CDA1 family)
MRGVKLVMGLALAMAMTAVGCAADDEHSEEEIASEWNYAYENRGSCSGVTVPDQAGFDKRIHLTFDDGPSAATTPQVLDILAAHDIKATFFINGMRVRGDAERQILSRMLEEGHELANHSQSHKNLKKLSAGEVDEQIRLTHEVIIEAGAEPAYFRFPFGSSSCATAEQARDYGYAITGWHVDTADWCFASGTGGVGRCDKRTFKYVADQYRDDMVGLTLSQARDNNGGIILFHDIHQNTVNNLEAIIQSLKGDGFSFVAIDDTDTFPLLNGETLPFVGDSCSGDADCNFNVDDATPSCLNYSGPQGEELGFCTVACDGFCPDAGGKAATFCVSLDSGASGSCVSKAVQENEQCATIAGTEAIIMDRYLGNSSATARQELVCVPSQ